MHMSGVVLAGGTSRRMGTDKATLELHGETLLARAARVLHDAGAAPVVVASGTAGRFGALPWAEIGDGAHAGAGPLAGILAAVRATTAPVVAVLAVDLPHASPDLLRWLARNWRPGDAAIIPVDADERAQPLHALVAASPATAAAIERHLVAGERRVQRVLAAVGGRRLSVPPEVAAPGWSRNWNRPE